MSTATLGGFLEHLRDGRAGGFASLTDGELVACFQAGRDEEAFAAILRRHGPMVLRVCRRVLRREEDAEDAFQATFLVLARRAGTLRNRASLASFLHGVAHRVSLEALDADARRRKHETRAAPRPPAADHEDLRTTLDEEVRRLPDRLRGPLVLWLLEGQTQDEVARQLGLSSSTCRRNLDRGRELLAARLTRRGVTLSAGALAALLAEGSANASGIVHDLRLATRIARGD